MSFLQTWKQWAKSLKARPSALYLAYQDPRTPWYAGIFAACVVGYAFSPIDLIPDFIPVIGLLDDLIIVPIGIALALKMIPPLVYAESQAKAELLMDQARPKNFVAAALIIAVWLALVALGIYGMFRLIQR